MSSSQIVPMSALETKLIDAAFCGEWAGPRELPASLSASQEADITVEGAFLRKLLLGLISPPATAGHNPRIHGVRLQGAIIKGEIDLSDCAGIGSARLPPLLLERCIVYGTAVKGIRIAIDASNARLSRLSLNGCRVDGRIDLTDAELDSDLEISDIAPLDERPCQVFARRCRINGSVVAENSHLRTHSTEFNIDDMDYALNLVNAEIHGSIILQPGFNAEGGVNIRGIRVNHDIWAEAAKLTASDKIAFKAESLQCAGVVALRGRCGSIKPEKREAACMVQGCVDFLGATIGYLDLRGIHISKSLSTTDKDYALRLELVRVKDDLRLYNRSNTLKTVIDGRIDAFNLRVGGDLTLDDLTTVSIDLTSSHVERNLSIKNSIVNAPDNQRYGLLARNITVGNDFNLEAVSGTVDLELSRIGGALTIRAKDLTALNAREAEVQGSVIISGWFRPRKKGQSLCFDGGSYLSGFYIGDPESKYLSSNSLGFLSTQSSPMQDDEWIPTLSIEDARIDNDFRVIGVWVVSTHLPKPKLLEVYIGALSDYRGWELVKALFSLDDGSETVVAFMQHLSKEPVLLIGLSEPRVDQDSVISYSYTDAACTDYKSMLSRYHAQTYNGKKTKQDIERILSQFGAQLENTQTGEIRDDILFMLRQLSQRRIPEKRADAPGLAEVSLRGLKVRMFHHDLKKSWVANIRLKLDGFEYDRVSTEESKARLNSVSGVHADESVEAHENWLSLQEHYGTVKGYEPQPFEQLARALRNDGKYQVANDITLKKLKLERILVYPCWTQPFLWIMEQGFSYGLFPGRGVLLIIFLLVSGTVFFDFLNYRCFRIPIGSQHNCTSVFDDKPVLVVHPVVVRGLMLPDMNVPDMVNTNDAIWLKDGRQIASVANPGPEMNQADNISEAQKKEKSIKEKPKDEPEEFCHGQVESFLYAVDVFVPLLDLRQEDRCSVTTRDDSYLWTLLRLLKALYAVIGAIATSIMVLTVSGMLRRYVER